MALYSGNPRLELPMHGVFSGADIVAGIYIPAIGSYKFFGELSTISYSTHREIVPVRGLGTINAKGFARGPRSIAGSLVFTVFDRHVLYDIQKDLTQRYINMLNENKYANVSRFAELKFITDEIPPFDIVISMMNERDPVGAKLRIYGVRVLNEGQVMSIDDLITENTMQYSAVGIDLMEPDYSYYTVESSADIIRQMEKEKAELKRKQDLERLFSWKSLFSKE
jgi:hypothetical protein